ncbi:MAG: hypothetical protein ACFE0J_16780 [Elainellaceae cyanobacterium]
MGVRWHRSIAAVSHSNTASSDTPSMEALFRRCASYPQWRSLLPDRWMSTRPLQDLNYGTKILFVCVHF